MDAISEIITNSVRDIAETRLLLASAVTFGGLAIVITGKFIWNRIDLWVNG